MYGNRSSRWWSARDGAAVRQPPLPRGADQRQPLVRAVPPGGRALRRFTLHLTFEAASGEEARERAVGYTEALALLCPEIALGAAAFSAADAWRQPEWLFCGALGPDGERCADVLGHPGFHHGPGVGSLGWGDGDSGGGEIGAGASGDDR